jgi:hypothetical protein
MRSIFLASLTLLLPVWTWHVSWGAVYVALNTQNKTLAFYTPSSHTFYPNQVTFNYLRASILRFSIKRFFMSIYGNKEEVIFISSPVLVMFLFLRLSQQFCKFLHI